MKTLLSLETPKLFLPKPCLWDPKIQPGLPTVIKNQNQNQNQNQPKPTWKLQANAKGFGSTPPATVKDDKNSNKNDDDEIPQEVFGRMIRRILFSVGVPLATGVALLHIFGVIKEQKLWEVPVWVPFLTTLITFGASTLGIAYGSLSASWDPDKTGSFLGLEEAQRNWVEMWKEENDGQW